MVTTLGEGEIFGQPYKCTSQLKTQYYQIKVKERITTGFHCLNFGDITHIRILLLQNMSPCSTHSEIKELKHQTFLFHKQHGWPRRTGSGTRFTCQNANHWANQCETITKAYRIIHLKLSFKSLCEVLFLSYEENMISDKEFVLMYDEYRLRRAQNLNLWFQPENSHFEVHDRTSRTSWHEQCLSCCSSTKNVWFLSCLSAFTWCQQGSQIRHIKCHKYWYNLSVFVCVEKIKGVKTVFLEVPKNCLYSR